LFTNTGWYVGPGAQALGGVDIGFVLAVIIGGGIYALLLKLVPEPSYVFGPQGARIAMESPEKSGEPMPITDPKSKQNA